MMGKHLLIPLLLLGYLSSAQNIGLVLERERNLTQSVPNPITIYGKNCSDFTLSTNNGRIEESSAACKFTIYPDSVGSVKIMIRNKSGKLIGEENYNAKAPEFFIKVQDVENNRIDANRLSKSSLALNSKDVGCLDLSWDANFELIIVDESNNTRIQVHAHNGNLHEVKDRFSLLKSGNIVIFHNAKIIINKLAFSLPDLVLEVK